ncbi:hypothetical protein CTH30272_02848 [Allocatenococcus thiocycli]|nr:hypothetical protein CTH30272_02848 [Catenococcus thiocycli]
MNKIKKKKTTMMKYNKKEEQAIEILFRLANGIKNKHSVYLHTSQCTLLKNVFGIDINTITLSKTEAKKRGFIRGKDKSLLQFDYYSEGWRERHCYFPFQVKK